MPLCICLQVSELLASEETQDEQQRASERKWGQQPGPGVTDGAVGAQGKAPHAAGPSKRGPDQRAGEGKGGSGKKQKK